MRVGVAVWSEVGICPPTSIRDIFIWALSGPRPTKVATSTRRGRERKLEQGRTVAGRPTRGLRISKTDRTDSLHDPPAGGGIRTGTSEADNNRDLAQHAPEKETSVP